MVNLILPTATIAGSVGDIARIYEADTQPYPNAGRPFHPRWTIGETCVRCGCLCKEDECCPGCQAGMPAR